MARIHTHYDNLKVARNAPPEVIRAAYKTLSQKHHPDRNGNSAEAIRIIQLINAAYEVLSDPVKRQEHDEWIIKAEAGLTADTASAIYSGAHAYSKASRRTGRSARSGFYMRHSRRSPLSQLAKAVQTAATMCDHFYRKLLRKV